MRAEDLSGSDWSARVSPPQDGHPSWVGVRQEGREESFEERAGVAERGLGGWQPMVCAERAWPGAA